MNKSVYLALIGATGAQKTPFEKHRDAALKGKLDHDMMEEEMMEEEMYYDLFLVKQGEDISKYFETFPQYHAFFDLSTTADNGDGTSTVDGWFNVVWDSEYMNEESCKTSTVAYNNGDPIDGVNVLAHEWNYNCSYEGQNLPITFLVNDEDAVIQVNGDLYYMYEYEDIIDFQDYGSEDSEDETWKDDDYEYQDFFPFPQGADLADYIETLPSYSVQAMIDTKSDPMFAEYSLYIYHDDTRLSGENYELCYLTATLDSNMAPSNGLTVKESDEYTYNCSLKDGEVIKYEPPVDETTYGAVYINNTMLDLYDYGDVMDAVYGEEDEDDMEDWEDDMEDWEDEWDYDYDDWEYDYDYAMEDYGYYDYYDYDYGYDYGYGEEWDYGYDYDYGMEDWDYYGYGETYYYMDGGAGPQGGPDGIMEQITGWFSGDASNKLFTAIASIATVAAMQL